MSDPDSQKRAAGAAAAALVEPGMVVGLGTGSTAVWFIQALAARGIDVVCVATSSASAELAVSLGLKVAELGETREIDLTVVHPTETPTLWWMSRGRRRGQLSPLCAER